MENNLKKDYIFENFINLKKSDAKFVLKMRNHKNIRKYMLNRDEISIQEHFKFIKSLENNYKKAYWLVKNLKSNTILGVFNLIDIDLNNETAYLGIYKNPYSNDKENGTIIINNGCSIFFNCLNLHTLKLEVFSDNIHAINFYKKIGFKKEGELREVYNINNKRKSTIIMGMLSKEWDKNHV